MRESSKYSRDVSKQLVHTSKHLSRRRQSTDVSRYSRRREERSYSRSLSSRSSRSPSSRSSSPRRKRYRRNSSSDEYYRKNSSRSSNHKKKYFGDNGIVLLFLPITTTENEISTFFQTQSVRYKKIRLKKNRDEITLHAFIELESLSACRQFVCNRDDGVVAILNCRIKVITENEYCNQIYMGSNLYNSPELPSSLQSDSLARSLIENPPCNVLIIKSLKYSATEEQVRESISTLTTDKLYDVRVIKDKSTGQSRGFCFVEMGNVADSTKLLNIILRKIPCYTICGRRILAGFARMNTYNSNGISSLLPTTVETFSAEKSPTVSRIANDAIAAAMLQTANVNPSSIESQMTYDFQSGYYYDPNTGFYFDSTTGYYYDPKTTTYLHYDHVSCQWIPLDNNIYQDTLSTKKQQKSIDSDMISNNSESQQNPQNIAKSMEKWAKKQNVNNKKSKRINDNISNAFQGRNAFQPVKLEKNEYNSQSDPFVLPNRLICLLCIRKFNSKATLEKHVNFSQLHKDNLILLNARTVVSLEEQLSKKSK